MMAADPDNTQLTITGDKIVEEASRRFRRCSEWEATARANFLDDYKFAHGDSDNGYQWPSRIRQNRDLDSRPCLTMNIVRQHNLQIVNEAKQNKSTVAFKATGGLATKDGADLYNAMFKRVEYQSNAQAAYETAQEYQVAGGWGWIRLVTEYENNKTFNQDMRIKRVWDPLSVMVDMDAQEKDKSDARYAFVFDLVPDEQLEEAYPGIKEKMSLAPLGGVADDTWTIKDHTRVCEYFRKVAKKDELVSFINPDTRQRVELKRSQMPDSIYEQVVRLPLTKRRKINDWVVEWYLICGQQVIAKTIWPGKYIPLILVLGEETIIDGVLDRKGHTRAMKDAQRMYNYNAAAQVEFGALQSKTPYIVAAKAIEEYESMWNTANTTNHSVLVYNHVNDDGVEGAVPAPQRQEPPNAAPIFEAGMQTAFNQMMMTSGQWQNQMGMGGNERTGEAISRRQDQGFTSVYHFANNYADSLRFIGQQYLDIVPKIYDTPRLMKLQMEDGEDFDLQLDPGAQQELQLKMNEDQQVVSRILNPMVGEYDVKADVGPAYGTRREESVRAMTLIMTQAPEIAPIIADLLLSAMDFKESTEAARRLKRMVPAQALGKGPTQAEQALQQQVDALQQELAKALQKVGEKQVKLLSKEELRDVQVYDAETRRVGALRDYLPEDEAGLRDLIKDLVKQSLATQISHIAQSPQLGG